MASLSLDVQQYNSGIGKGGTARGVEGVYVRVGHISIVDLAHLAVLRLFPTSTWWDALASSNSPAFDVLLVNSEQVVTSSWPG